jgi:tetratricopeptide (TPR) repeat protein
MRSLFSLTGDLRARFRIAFGIFSVSLIYSAKCLAFDYGLHVEQHFSTQYKQKTLEKYIGQQLQHSSSLPIDQALVKNWYMLLGAEVSLFQNDFKNSWYWLSKVEENNASPRLLSRFACNKIMLLMSTNAFTVKYSYLVKDCSVTKQMDDWEKSYVLATNRLANVLLGKAIKSETVILNEQVNFPNEYREILTEVLVSLIDASEGRLEQASARASGAYEKSKTFTEPTLLFATTQNYSVILNRQNNTEKALDITNKAIKKAEEMDRIPDLVNAMNMKASIIEQTIGIEQAIEINKEAFNLAIQNQLIQGVLIHAKDLSAHYRATQDEVSLQELLDRTEGFVKLISFYEDFKPQEVLFYNFLDFLKSKRIQHPILTMRPDKVLSREDRMRNINFN